jgi:phenylacetate-CoA ligase
VANGEVLSNALAASITTADSGSASPLPRLGQWRSAAELTALQDAQLPHTLSWAAGSPFYQSMMRDRAWPKSRADLANVPLTTKQDLRDNYPFGMLAINRTEVATYHESSGTSGEPTPSFYTAEDWLDLAERYARKWTEIRPSDMFLVRTPYALGISGHLGHAAARLRGATVVPADMQSRLTPVAQVVRVMRDLEVSITWSLPTETLLWAAAARAAGYRPSMDFPALRAMFVGGEPLSSARRRRIAEIWNVPVVQEYGSTETGTIAGACQYGTLHLWADRAIFEVYNPVTGTTAPSGSGQLVVTPLYRKAMPLLRYNLEDDVEIDDADCVCGWQLPAVRIHGRTGFGYPVGQVTVSQPLLEELVFGLPSELGVLFWRARAEPERLFVEIEVSAEARDTACRLLAKAIDTAYRIPCEVSGVPAGTVVPTGLLTAAREGAKPRYLFGPGEDWTTAIVSS